MCLQVAIDIRARLKQKATVPKTTLALDDVNRDLIVSLFSVGIYGAEARDEEIHNIIIGGGVLVKDAKKIMREEFNAIKSTLKKGKDGVYHDKNGFIVLEPA